MPAPKGNKNAKGNKGGGTKSSYRPEYAEQAQKLCAIAGFTDQKLAEFFEVSEMTINRWKLAHVEFALALKAGKSVTDDLVERAVLQGITGYYVEIEEMNNEGIVRKIKKWIAGNPGVGMKWLAARRPEIYREVKQVNQQRTLKAQMERLLDIIDEEIMFERANRAKLIEPQPGLLT